jgi:P4 family phage/plasmid primase-like protien
MSPLNPVVMSKLDRTQERGIAELRVRRPDIDVSTLVDLMADGIFDRGLRVPSLVRAVEVLGPLAIDQGKRIWRYDEGVWKSDGEDELTRRVQLCTGERFRKDHVSQAATLIKAREPQIQGLGPSRFINVKNGMLDWETLELHKHDPNYFSTYQVTVAWNSDAVCPTVDQWFDETFDTDLHSLLWQVAGVVVYPGMGFQKIVVLLGDGYNGKGTFQRLCLSLLPKSAYTSIDPRELVNNRFKPAELFGKTANICGDIERFTFNSSAELKKISGDDPINAERKNGHPFTFINQAFLLFAANKMPQSRDTSHGWHRRWLIVPLARRISGSPDHTLEERLQAEREGVLVKAVMALREAMRQGGFDTPEACLAAGREYEHACNSAILFINERLRFDAELTTPLSRSDLYAAYRDFCRRERLDAESRNKFYELLQELGRPHLRDHWANGDERKRGYVGVGWAEAWLAASF